MSNPVTIIDYGIGNMLSVVRAFEYCGAYVTVSESLDSVNEVERLVLPGVGAFANGMAELSARNLVEPIQAFAATGKPFLGICLGMQMMLDTSEEFGQSTGLGLIPGQVVAIPSYGIDGIPHKIPHIGWNELLRPVHPGDWKGSILTQLSYGTPVYFVHSFMAVPENGDHRLADCHYDGQAICAAIRRDNIYGCQFHPEKSGEAGLAIVREFLRL